MKHEAWRFPYYILLNWLFPKINGKKSHHIGDWPLFCVLSPNSMSPTEVFSNVVTRSITIELKNNLLCDPKKERKKERNPTLSLGGHLCFNPTPWVQGNGDHQNLRMLWQGKHLRCWGRGVQADATIETVGNSEWSLHVLYRMILQMWMFWASCGSRCPQHPLRIFWGCCYGQVFVWNCLAPMLSLCLDVPLRWSMCCRCHTGSACRWGWYSWSIKPPVGWVFYRLQCICRYNGYCLPRVLQVLSSYFAGLAFLREVHCLDATWRCCFYCWGWAAYHGVVGSNIMNPAQGCDDNVACSLVPTDLFHFPTRALPQTPFLGTKIVFPTDSQGLPRKSSQFLQKGWDSRKFI